jgi:hypothetical protein
MGTAPAGRPQPVDSGGNGREPFHRDLSHGKSPLSAPPRGADDDTANVPESRSFRMPQLVRPSHPAVRTLRPIVRRAIGLATGAALAASALPAQTIIASSGFTSGAEGWTITNLFPGFAANCTPTAPTHVASGGNPGGFIRTNDRCAQTGFLAPSAYVGNRSDALGGALSFSLRASPVTFVAISPLVTLVGGGLTIGVETTVLPNANGWTDYVVPFSVGGWRRLTGVNTYGALVSETEFTGVLQNLTALLIKGEWATGADQVDLDAVSLSNVNVVPEPSAYALMATGLVGLGAMARRRRRA